MFVVDGPLKMKTVGSVRTVQQLTIKWDGRANFDLLANLASRVGGVAPLPTQPFRLNGSPKYDRRRYTVAILEFDNSHCNDAWHALFEEPGVQIQIPMRVDGFGDSQLLTFFLECDHVTLKRVADLVHDIAKLAERRVAMLAFALFKGVRFFVRHADVHVQPRRVEDALVVKPKANNNALEVS